MRELLCYIIAMKNIISKNRIIAAVLAAAIALSCFAACGKAQASVVQRKIETNRGTGFHAVQ